MTAYPLHWSQSVRSQPSREYMSLPVEVRQSFENLLAERPVKLGAIAARLGVKVLLSTLPRGISGRIGQEDGDFVIRINRHEAEHRQRFTLAHELAHFLLHRDRIVAEGGWSENVLLRAPNQPIEVDQEATRLALDLIMPLGPLAEAAKQYAGATMGGEVIEDLARLFRVSPAFMLVRLDAAIRGAG